MENRKENPEQYEDTVLAAVMDSYAQSDGEQLLEEFENAKTRGEVPELPDALDGKGKHLVSRWLSRQKNADRKRRLLRFAAKAAIWLLILAPVAAATIMAVDANNQVYIDRFLKNGCSLSEMEDRYVIHFRQYPAKKEQDHEKVSRLMQEFIPEEYTLAQEYQEDFGGGFNPGLYSRYTDGEGHVVRLVSAQPISGKLIIYKDGCTATEISYMGYDMVLVEWENAREIHWLDDEEGLRYSIYADALSDQVFWDLVFEIARS